MVVSSIVMLVNSGGLHPSTPESPSQPNFFSAGRIGNPNDPWNILKTSHFLWSTGLPGLRNIDILQTRPEVSEGFLVQRSLDVPFLFAVWPKKNLRVSFPCQFSGVQI